ncbi:MAG: hypothetical protein QM673_07570, partial [Gordonia sp. (in: high G+C Gram-positive bacteria)]
RPDIGRTFAGHLTRVRAEIYNPSPRGDRDRRTDEAPDDSEKRLPTGAHWQPDAPTLGTR